MVRRRSAGFTLLEVMVAMVLTGIVALVAYGAAHVSIESREVVHRHLRAVQNARAAREVLQDLLRNARAPQRPGDPKFLLEPGRLSFAASGAGPPLDAGYDWHVTVERDSGGLRFVADPIGRARVPGIAFRVAGVTRWEVKVLPAPGSEWVTEWANPATMPRAVAVTLWSGADQLGPPIQAPLTPGPSTAVDRGYFEGYDE